MPTVTFDGPTKEIRVGYDGFFTEIDAIDIYSLWKDWVLAGNAQFLPAFAESVGGNPLGGSIALGSYLFINNDLGWRIVPSNNDHTLTISGDLYPSDPGTAFVSPPASDVLVVFQRSSATQSIASGGSGGGGLTTEESDALLSIHADLEVINRGVRKASLLIPHNEELGGGGTPPPMSGEFYEVWNQPVASDVWSITHSLDYYPAVNTFDTAGDEIEGDVKHPTVNTVVITFSSPVSGVAYLS